MTQLAHDEWHEVVLSEATRTDAPIGYGIVQPGPNTQGGVPVVAIRDLPRPSAARVHRSAPAIEAAYRRSRIVGGDILISVKGTTGRIGLVPKGFRGNISRDVARIRLRTDQHPEYWFQLLQSHSAQQTLQEAAVGSTRQELSMWTLRGVRFTVPGLSEQQAIARRLADTDSLISAVERLIAKKHAIKQGMMHQLLSGATRLPGFSEIWEEMCLGAVIGSLEAGVSVNSEPSPGRYAVLKTSSVAAGKFFPYESKSIAQWDLLRAKVSPAADCLIISRMNTPALVGEVGYVASDWPNLFLPDRLWLARPRPGTSIEMRWLGYMLSSPGYSARLKQMATGTSGSMKNISKDSLLNVRISCPTWEEQKSIANALHDVDDQIDALQLRLTKARDVRHGMMQQLLTGRTRLPVLEAAS